MPRTRNTNRGFHGSRRPFADAEPLEPRLLLAATLIQDVNTTPSATVLPAPLTAVGNLAFFAGNDGVHGAELWKTNGTAAGTAMVKDVRPGAASSSPTSITNVNGIAYFVADDGVHGPELWRSNGADGGTVLVKDINPGATGSAPSLLTAASTATGPVLYFFADDGTAGRELWRSDGTAAGTTLVADLKPGVAGLAPGGMAATADGTVYFSAAGGPATKAGLWRSDGTAAGTTLVTTSPIGSVTQVHASGPRVYFTDSSNGIFSSDGTAAGTVQVESWFGPSTLYDWVGEGNGTIYYARDDAGDGLYRIDPGATAVQLIKDAGTGFTYQDRTDLTLWKGNLYFIATDSTNGREVHRVAAGAITATLLKDIYPGPGSDSPDNLALVGNALFFTSGQSFSGYTLWRSDGTDAGTQAVGPIASKTARPPSDGIAVGSTYVFVNDDGTNGPELWHSDGTVPGTGLVKAIYPGTAPSAPTFLGAIGNVGLFTVHNATTNTGAMWRTDGTAAGTYAVYDGWPAIYEPRNAAVVGGRLYFAAGNSTTGSELWATDGTVAGTGMLKDINPGSGVSSNPAGFTALGNWAFFSANDGTHGQELWRTDGTAAGTVLVADTRTGVNSGMSSSPTFAVVNGRILFGADNGSTGMELWSSDGTTGGTALVKDATAGSTGATLRFGPLVGNTLYYGRGGQLWRTDGTPGGTVLIYDFKPTVSSEGFVDAPVRIGSVIYFASMDAAGVRGLWRSDGTAAGTTLVAAVAPRNLTVVNEDLFFFVSGVYPNGATLWRSDGTPAGTGPVAQVTPTTDIGYPRAPVVSNGRLFFVTTMPDTGAELWSSDGTAAGTGPAQDLNAGPGDGAAGTPVVVTNGTIYFTGDDGVSGLEPYRLSDTFAPVIRRGDFAFAGKHALSLTFNEDVGASLVAGDLVVTNLDTGGVVNSPSISRTYDATTRTATFTFPGLAGGVLPDGNYRATFKAGSVTDAAGNPVATTTAFDFFALAGDANRDRRVDFADLVKLAQNYNSSGGKTWDAGDFTGDGAVDFNDLVVLAQRYNTALPGTTPAAATVAASFDTAWAAARSVATAPSNSTTATSAEKRKHDGIFSVTPVARPVAPARPKTPARAVRK